MTRQELIESASLLHEPSEKVMKKFSSMRVAITAKVNFDAINHFKKETRTSALRKKMIEKSNRSFSLFMEFLLTDFHPEIFVDTLIWVFHNHKGYGMETLYWPECLDLWNKHVIETLPSNCSKEILPFIRWLADHIATFAERSQTHMVIKKGLGCKLVRQCPRSPSLG